MASTRNRNTPGNYHLEQLAYQKAYDTMSYESSSYYGVPSVSYFAGNGLIGMKTAHRNLSSNYCDIESQLFGIGSTNLVSPVAPVQPNIHNLKSLNIFDKQAPVSPAPFAPQPNQRPMYLN